MDRTGIRGVIQFFFMEGKIGKEIHERTAPTLSDSCPSYETVQDKQRKEPRDLSEKNSATSTEQGQLKRRAPRQAMARRSDQ
ncbi:Uncharacterized protein GBIM_07566, partial [Gryllus bimaculatus]